MCRKVEVSHCVLNVVVACQYFKKLECVLSL